jgi:hypothetical protein
MPILLTNSIDGQDLITLDRALMDPTLAALNTSNPSALPPLITAASRAIERVCKRIFAAQDYSLFLSAGPRPCDWIALPNFPVLSITRLATKPLAAIAIVNNDSTDNQRATVATTATGLQLTVVSLGTSSTVNVAYSSYPTLAALAGAVSGIGSGWSASAMAAFANFPSTDLRPLQGAMPALNTAAMLEIFTEELSAWAGVQNVWDWAAGSSVGCGWQLDADAGLLVGRFAEASNDLRAGPVSLRCDYRAGFETIPEDIQQAATRLAALIQEDEQRDSTVAMQTVGPYTQKYFPAASNLLSNPAVMELISPYIDHAKVLGRVWP